jgi:hypothetical protein
MLMAREFPLMRVCLAEALVQCDRCLVHIYRCLQEEHQLHCTSGPGPAALLPSAAAYVGDNGLEEHYAGWSNGAEPLHSGSAAGTADDLYYDGAATLEPDTAALPADHSAAYLAFDSEQFARYLRESFTEEDIAMMQLSSDSDLPTDAAVNKARVAFDFTGEKRGCYTMANIREALKKAERNFPLMKSFSPTVSTLPKPPAKSIMRRQLPLLADIKFPRLAIGDAILQLLSRRIVADDEYLWYATPKGSLYGDVNSGDAWRAAEATHATHEGNDMVDRLLYLMFYTDETVKSTIGSQKYYPVYMTLGNFPRTVKKSPKAWILVGLIPTWKVSKVPGYGHEYTQYVRNKCWELIVEDLTRMMDQAHTQHPFCVGRDAFDRSVNGIPVIGCIMGDNPELLKLCSCCASAQARRPCRVCMVLISELAKIHVIRPELRTLAASKLRLQTLWGAKTKKAAAAAAREIVDASQKPWASPFWKAWFALGKGEVYPSTPADLLHTFGTGIVKRLLSWAFEVAKAGGVATAVLATRWNLHFSNMPLFGDGIHRLKRVRTIDYELTGFLGTEILSIFQQIVCVIGFNEDIIPNPAWRSRVQQVMHACHRIVQAVYVRSDWSEADLDDLDACIHEFVTVASAEAPEGMPPLSIEVPKLHSLFHLAAAIRNFGAPQNFDAGQCESLHVSLKKEGDRAARGKRRDESLLQRDTARNKMLHVLSHLGATKRYEPSDSEYVVVDPQCIQPTTNLRGYLLQNASGEPYEYSLLYDSANVKHSSSTYRTGALFPDLGGEYGPLHTIATQATVQWLQSAQVSYADIVVPDIITPAGVEDALDTFSKLSTRVHSTAIVKASGTRRIAYKVHSVLGDGADVSVVSVSIAGVVAALPCRVEMFLSVTYRKAGVEAQLAVLRPFQQQPLPPAAAPFLRTLSLDYGRVYVIPLCSIIRQEWVFPHFCDGPLMDLLHVMEVLVCKTAAANKPKKKGVVIEEDDEEDNDSGSDDDTGATDIAQAYSSAADRAVVRVAVGPAGVEADVNDIGGRLRRMTALYEAPTVLWSPYGIFT